MSDSTQRQKQIVVAFDFSPDAEVALARALDDACRDPSHVVHVVTPIDPHRGLSILPSDEIDYTYSERVEEVAHQRVQAAFESRSPTHPVHFFIHPRIGKAADEILGAAHELGADQIFLAPGAAAERVVRDARCPVTIMRPKGYEDVELTTIVEVEHAKRHYTPPHRYSYTSTGQSAFTRPDAWPVA